MASNRKVTDFFKRLPSSQSSSSSSSANSHSEKAMSQPPKSAAKKSSSQSPPVASGASRTSIPISDAEGKRTQPLIIDVDTLTSDDEDSSIELVPAPLQPKTNISSASSRAHISTTAAQSRVTRALHPLAPSRPQTVNGARGKPIVIDISSDSASSTTKRKSVIDISSSSSDSIVSSQRPFSNSQSKSKKRRVSESTSSPIEIRDTSEEEKHVEITLSLPSSHPTTSQDAVSDDDMDWAPTPAVSQTLQSLSPLVSEGPLQASSPHSVATSPMSDTHTNLSGFDGDNDSDGPPQSVKSLPRRGRSVTTPPTSVSPPSAVNETAQQLIARMKAAASKKHEPSSSDESDVEKQVTNNRTARLLEEESSDEELNSPLSLFTSRNPSTSATSLLSRPNLSTTSSLSSAPIVDSDGDVAMTKSTTDNSSPEGQGTRRSTRPMKPPKVIAPITLPTSRKKLSEFDRLLKEDDWRMRQRGGRDGYERAGALLQQNVDGSSDHDSEDDSDDAGSVGGASKNSRHLGSTRSQSSRGRALLHDGDQTNSDDDNSIKPGTARAARSAARSAPTLTTLMQRENIGFRVKKGISLWSDDVKDISITQKLEVSNDLLVAQIVSAVEGEKYLEASIAIQKWASYHRKQNLDIRREFVTVALHHVICSENACLGDSTTSQLVMLMKSYPTELTDVGLSAHGIILAASCALGAKHEALRGLKLFKTDPLRAALSLQRYPVIATGTIHRAHCAARYLRLFSALPNFACSSLDEVSDLLHFLLLIACDPSSVPDISRSVTITIQLILSTPQTSQNELDLCNSLVQSLGIYSWSEKEQLLSNMPDHNTSSKRMTSWLAFGLLLPKEMSKVTAERYQNPPSLEHIIAHLHDHGRTQIDKNPLFDLRESEEPAQQPNYEVVDDQISILALLVHDVRAFVEQERDVDKLGVHADNGSHSFLTTHKKQSSVLERLNTALDRVHGSILDGGGAHLNRTRVKENIKTLQMCVEANRCGAISFAAHREGRATRRNLDAHFARKSSLRLPTPPIL